MHFFKKGGQTGIGKKIKENIQIEESGRDSVGDNFFFIILYNYNLSVSNYEILKFGGKLFYVSDHLATRKHYLLLCNISSKYQRANMPIFFYICFISFRYSKSVLVLVKDSYFI